MPEISWTQIGRFSTRKDSPPTPAQQEVLHLFGELRAPLLRYLHTLGVSLPDGEDVVQEAFLALFHHLTKEKPRDNLHGWVFRVSRNIALKRLRQNTKLSGLADELVIADPSANPEELALQGDQHRSMRLAASALPELDRQCLHLRAQGFRYRQIAEIMEISLGSVAQIMSRALGRLARATQK